MSAIWTHFEVTWETHCAYLNAFFDTRERMEAYAEILKTRPHVLKLQTHEHASPHHGPTITTTIKPEENR